LAKLAKIVFLSASILLALVIFYQFRTSITAKENQGVLEIQLKDHREAIGDFAVLHVTTDAVLLSRKAVFSFWHSQWHALRPVTESTDLTQYVGGKTALLFHGPIDVANFDGFHLRIKRIEGILRKTQRAVPVKNTVGPVTLSFEVRPRQQTLLIIDLVVTDFSDHPPHGYELGVKGYELYIDSKRVAKIPPD
jgi:hypothetical protein